jgi:trimethylamine--corrinoid protein Co-methyltransferase
MPQLQPPLNPPFYSRLDELQASRIHQAALEILERIGVRLDLPQAVDLLRDAGAQVVTPPGGEAAAGHQVRIPARLVDDALAKAPRSVTLHDRFGGPVMPLLENHCFFGPGSDCLNIIDHRTGQRRKPLMGDVVEGVRLCDALPNIDFVMSMFLPSDVDQQLADVFQAEAMFANTAKPLIFVSYEAHGLQAAVEMAEALAGGAEALRLKPTLACYINVVSGAAHNAESLRKLLFLAGKGLPALYIPGSNACVTSPATLAGAIALDYAGGLAGLVLAQLKRPGAPFVLSAMDPASLDLRTMVGPYAYPERGFIRDVARRSGLPGFSMAGCSDSKLVDQQAAAEAALTLMSDVLMGGNIIHDLGYLESGLTFSFTQLAICDQIVDWIKAFFTPLEVSDETLALDVIEGVGPEGGYLKHPHTRRHYRSHWYPDLFDRHLHSDWLAQGGKSLGERAAGRVQALLESHQPPSLDASSLARLHEIRAAYTAPPS